MKELHPPTLIENRDLSDMSRLVPVHKMYSIYGLSVQSDIELPGLEAVSVSPREDSAVDVRVFHAQLPDALYPSTILADWLEVNQTQCLFTVPGVGRFMVENGRQISYEPQRDVSSLAIQAYILGSGLGTILHQRQMVPLHLSSVLSPSGLIGFTGDSGAGKSTIAAALHEEYNWGVVSDDLGVLDIDNGEVRLLAGPKRMKLWKDTLDYLHIEATGLQRDFIRQEKFHLDISGDTRLHSLTKLFVLQEAPETVTHRVFDGEALRHLVASIYRPYLTGIFNDRARVFDALALLLNKCEVYELRRPRSAAGIRESLLAVEKLTCLR